jgi:hypothetical protein
MIGALGADFELRLTRPARPHLDRADFRQLYIRENYCRYSWRLMRMPLVK